MTGQIRVLKKYEPFVLGFCNCGCNTEIEIRSKWRRLNRFKHGHSKQLRENNQNWRGGRTKKGNYWMLYMPDYFSSQSNGYVYEHIYFYQEYHKCCVLPWTIIHHIIPVSKDYCNNMPWNLMGMTNKQHTILHMTDNRYGRKDKTGRRCSKCNIDKVYPGKYENWYGNKEDGWLCGKCYQIIKRKKKNMVTIN